MAGITTLLDFILRLLSDPELAEAFSEDPQGSLAENGLGQVLPQEASNAVHSVTTLLGGPTHFVPVPHMVAVPVMVGASGGSVGPSVGGGVGGSAGTSTADILQSFVNNYYADSISVNNVWAGGDVTQAIAEAGGIAIVGGEEVEEINVATEGSVAISGGVEDTGIALAGGVAAGGDVEFEGNGDVVIGDGNIAINGDGNTVVGDDQVNLTGSIGANVALDGSLIQNADNGGVNAGVEAIVDSNVAGGNLAVGDGAVAANGNVAQGAGAISTTGNVASGAYSQAAGDNSNLASDDDVFSPTVNTTGDVTIDMDDSDAITSGNNSTSASDGAIVATGSAVVSQDNDNLTNTTNVGAGAAVGSVDQSNSVDSNSAVGTGNVAADDQSVAANNDSSAAGHTGGGDAQAASGGSQVADDGSLNAGNNGVIGDGGVAASDSTVAYTTGDDSDAAIASDGGMIAQDEGAVAGGDVYDDNATVEYNNSFNEDSNFTEGDDSPIIAASDDSEIEDVEFD